jgi:hypothetical protein
MKTIHAFVGAGTLSAVPRLTIICDQSVPDMEQTEDYRTVYRQEAVRLLDAMSATMPGGLVDALLAELCARKASLLRVPLGS